MQITIFGAGAGISNAVATLFGKQGYNIALVARNEEKLKKEVEALENQGIQAMYAVADVGNEEQLQAAMSSILNRFGHAEMLLYNAYSPTFKSLEDDTWESIQQQLNVNVGGAFNVLKRVLPYFKKENKGKLFFTGGGLAMQPNPKLVGLSLGKAALRNLVANAAESVKGTNVHVATVTVCGFVNPKHSKYNPDAIAQEFWKLFNQQPNEFETEIIY